MSLIDRFMGERDRPAMKAPKWSRFEHGAAVKVIQRRPDSVNFPGWVVGWYERTDGWRGYVLEHRYDRITHVYGEKSVAVDNSVKEVPIDG